MSDEVFRIQFTTSAGYDAAKSLLTKDLGTLGLQLNPFTFDDAARSIISHQSHYYLRQTLRGTPSAATLLLDTDTYHFFTNQNHDRSMFSVKPNLPLYRLKRQEALDYYASLPDLPSFTDRYAAIGSLPDDPRQAIPFLLKHTSSSIGERHEQRAAKAALVDAMPTIRSSGASILLEHAFENHQSLIDQYLQSADVAVAPDIGTYFDQYDNSFGAFGDFGLVGLLIAAKTSGVRIQGIETPFSLDAGAFGAIDPLPTVPAARQTEFRTYDRLLMMNYRAAKLAADNAKSGRKSIVLCGGAHISDYSDPGSGRNLSGLSTIFRCPTYFIEDKRPRFTTTCQTSNGNFIHYWNPDGIRSCERHKETWLERVRHFFDGISRMVA